MKKGLNVIGIISLFLMSLLLMSLLLTACKKSQKENEVTLVFTSWRTEDIERMGRVNAVFMKENPHIKIDFQPINDTEYDANMLASLKTGTGADILFLRSYDSGRSVYNAGYLYELNQAMPNLKSFPEAPLKAWSTEEGIIYGVPSVGVTHGIFYHKEIFKKYNLGEPRTWTELIDVCKVLKANGETVFAQGAMDEWTLYEVAFSGLGANFYGGEKSRQALLQGKMKLTDPPFLNAFKAIDGLQQFMPKGYESIDYVSMQQLFGSGRAAMFIGGSWEIGVFEDLGTKDLGWFKPPVVKEGDKLQYCFHVDAGIGLNKNTKHLEEALVYLKWLSSPEYAELIMNELPGFFSYTPGTYNLTHLVAKKMIDAASGADLTVRTVWEKMSAQSPSGNALMGEALPGMLKDIYTPEQAAIFVQEGIDSWYIPEKIN